jgi:hypothetical protein
LAPLLDLDEDLGRGLTPALYEQVRRWLVVPVWSLRRGRWAAGLESGDDMGLPVLDGVIARSVSLGRIAYPELLGAGDVQRRADELDLQMAIAQLPLIELRLLGVLWRIAGRWGVDTPQGVHVPVRLTHAVLAALVLGRRSSTSRALTSLARRGLVTHVHDGWMLHGEPPRELHTVSRTASPLALGG